MWVFDQHHYIAQITASLSFHNFIEFRFWLNADPYLKCKQMEEGINLDAQYGHYHLCD